MPNWHMELDGKSYDFDPARDFSLADWDRMESAFGEDCGGWFSFERLIFKGSHKAARCLIWGAKRKAGEPVAADPRHVELPADFAMGVFLDQMLADTLTRKEEQPDPLPDGAAPESPPDGSAPSDPSGTSTSV